MAFLTGLTTWLFGGGGMNKAVDQVDKAFHTEQERAQEDAADLANARQFAGMSNAPGFFNQVVDAMNRLIRPGVTFWLVGGFVGWWPLPGPEHVNEFWQNILLLVLTFWFGGRAILKDLPTAIQAMRR